jgi:hypothetical protein
VEGLRLEGRVQRVAMVSRAPAYEVGVSLRAPGAGAGPDAAFALLRDAARDAHGEERAA